jgi:deoxyadenosine/deoxycytidine kinase
MQIELIGCTGVGKSTLVKKMLQSCRENGIIACTGDQFVLKQMKLGWIKNYYIRTIFVDIFTLSACLLTCKSNSKFYRLVMKMVTELPASVNWIEKLNIVRNTFKKLGAVEIIRHLNTFDQIVFLDEGTIHTAHYLFVQPFAPPPKNYLNNFLHLIPLPDVVVYLQEDESVLVERIQTRKHRRTHNQPYESVRKFVRNAINTFKLIEHQPLVQEKLILINGKGDIKTPDDKKNDSIAMVLELLKGTVANVVGDITEKKYA